MAQISHILFDLGNTLLYFDGDWPDVFSRALAAVEAAAAREGFAGEAVLLAARFRSRMESYYLQRDIDLVEQTSARVLAACFTDLELTPPAPAQLAGLLSAFYAGTQPHWRIAPDAIETLSHLRRSGFALGVLSNAAHDADVQTLVDRGGLRPFMDFVLTSAAIGRRKPHPEAFAAALTHWGVPASSIVMVGDTPAADILGARNCGMTSVWVRRYAQVEPEPDCRPDFITDRLADLSELMKILRD